eukprot:2104280-Pyramimonas_sp.AAC.1
MHELHDDTACGATFPTMKGLNAHVIFAHQFRNEYSLAIRTNTRPWAMTSFASKASCIRHVWTMASKTPRKCPARSVSFGFRPEPDPPCTCRHCGLVHQDLHAHLLHVREHAHGPEPQDDRASGLDADGRGSATEIRDARRSQRRQRRGHARGPRPITLDTSHAVRMLGLDSERRQSSRR